MRTCLIYGHDGFDVDVLANLTALYRSLGFVVSRSRSLRPADLLVIQRIPDRPLPTLGYQDVHVYDYVGTPYRRFLHGLEREDVNLAVFCSSSARHAEIQSIAPALRERIHVQLPPVKVELWARERPSAPTYKVVHIGNFKPYYSEMSDPHASAFMRTLHHADVRVWGDGWPATWKHPVGHSRLALRNVSQVYARSTFALGMMYPFQRRITLSGRFWHAPLNGSMLISEPSIYAESLPGVVASDFSTDDVTRILRTKVDSSELQHTATRFWQAAYAETTELVAGLITPTGRRKWNGRRSIASIAGMRRCRPLLWVR